MPTGYYNTSEDQRLGIIVNNDAGSALAGFIQITIAGVVSLQLPAIGASGEDLMFSTRFPLN
jgi:hypothetical protein